MYERAELEVAPDANVEKTGGVRVEWNIGRHVLEPRLRGGAAAIGLRPGAVGAAEIAIVGQGGRVGRRALLCAVGELERCVRAIDRAARTDGPLDLIAQVNDEVDVLFRERLDRRPVVGVPILAR